MEGAKAIRCAKAAFLLYSLKTSSKRYFKTPVNDQDELEKDLMLTEIEDLKMKLARERIKNKKIKLCGLIEVILQVMVVLSCSTVLLMLAFKSSSN